VSISLKALSFYFKKKIKPLSIWTPKCYKDTANYKKKSTAYSLIKTSRGHCPLEVYFYTCIIVNYV